MVRLSPFSALAISYWNRFVRSELEWCAVVMIRRLQWVHRCLKILLRIDEAPLRSHGS